MAMPKVLFVCLGNICRSPTAEAVFRRRSEEAGLDVDIDSAGTGAWHAGDVPDPRARDAGSKRGYSFAGQKARKITQQDFVDFDYILAMDQMNMTQLKSLCPAQHEAKLSLLMQHADNSSREDIPDPYYGGDEGFEHVLDLIEAASDGLIAKLKA